MDDSKDNHEQEIDQSAKSNFEEAASEKGLVAEFFEFLMDNKKLWMIPILLVLALLGLLIVFSGSSAAPFIYTLF